MEEEAAAVMLLQVVQNHKFFLILHLLLRLIAPFLNKSTAGGDRKGRKWMLSHPFFPSSLGASF